MTSLSSVSSRSAVSGSASFTAGAHHTISKIGSGGEFEDVDCIVYGHSHYPANHIRQGVLFFNPGTAFDRRHNVSKTVGILEVGEEAITGRIVAVDED